MNATPAQVALAWLLAQKPWIVPSIDLAGHGPRCPRRGWLVLPGLSGGVRRAYDWGRGFARSRLTRRSSTSPSATTTRPRTTTASTAKVKPTIVVASDQAGCWSDQRTRMPPTSMVAGGAGLTRVVTADPAGFEATKAFPLSV
jgi:hypothetical protein